QPPANASFIGTLTGSSLGLVAILLGALFNAHLNRCRDDRLREADRIALASTLYAELRGVHQSLVKNAEYIIAEDLSRDAVFSIPQPVISAMPDLLPRLGLLSTDTIRKVLDAYIVGQQYLVDLIVMGGLLRQARPDGRQVVELSAQKTQLFDALNKSKAAIIQDATNALARYL